MAKNSHFFLFFCFPRCVIIESALYNGGMINHEKIYEDELFDRLVELVFQTYLLTKKYDEKI